MAERLQQSQLLASLGTMTAGIAHEVNNPLGSILLFSELLMKEEISPGIKKDLKIIHDEARRAAKIMSELLNFKQEASIQNRRLNMQKLINNLIERRKYEQNVNNISIYANLPDQPLYIKGNSVEINQVLMNILINAEEALSIRKYGTIIINARAEKSWLRLTIADDGPGIPNSNLGLIFHPFFTTKGVGEGAGLGLSTCYNIITRHDGLIRAENNDMGGATIIIELPLVENEKKEETGKRKTNQPA